MGSLVRTPKSEPKGPRFSLDDTKAQGSPPTKDKAAPPPKGVKTEKAEEESGVTPNVSRNNLDLKPTNSDESSGPVLVNDTGLIQSVALNINQFKLAQEFGTAVVGNLAVDPEANGQVAEPTTNQIAGELGLTSIKVETAPQEATKAGKPAEVKPEPNTKVKPDAGKVEPIGTVTAEAVTPKGEKSSDDAGKDSGEGSKNSNSQTQLIQPETPKVTTTTSTTASASTESKKEPLTVDQHAQVIRTVTDRIQLMAASRSKEQVTIELNPPDLGKVSISIRNIRASLDAQISASDSRVRQAIESSKEDLASKLRSQGVSINEIKVGESSQTATDGRFGHTNHQSTSFNFANQHNMQQAYPSRNLSQARYSLNSNAVAVDSVAWGTPTGFGVDYRI